MTGHLGPSTAWKCRISGMGRDVYCVSVMTATLFVMRPYIFVACEADVSVALRGALLKEAVSKDVVFC